MTTTSFHRKPMSKWPEIDAIPTARQFCKKSFDRGKTQHCSVGHIRALFGTELEGVGLTFSKAWLKRAEAMGILPKPLVKTKGGIKVANAIININDSPTTTIPSLASCFEATLIDVGYQLEPV